MELIDKELKDCSDDELIMYWITETDLERTAYIVEEIKRRKPGPYQLPKVLSKAEKILLGAKVTIKIEKQTKKAKIIGLEYPKTINHNDEQ